MATVVYRKHRKLPDGSYETVHCETSSGVVLRPDGTTVEQGLTNISNSLNSYLPKTGGQLTGAVTFANSTLNLVGDDCYLGDQDVGGCVCIKGNNAETGLRFIGYSNAGTNNTIRYNEGHGLYVQGTVEPGYATLKNIQGSTSDIGAGASLSTGYIYLVYE